MRHNSGRNVARQQAKDCVRLSMTPPFMTRAAPRLGSREGLSALTRPACCCSRPVEKLVPDGPPSKLAALACLSGWTGLVVNRRPTAEHHANRCRSSSGRAIGGRHHPSRGRWPISSSSIPLRNRTRRRLRQSHTVGRANRGLATRRTSRWCSTAAAREDQRHDEVATGQMARFRPRSSTSRETRPARPATRTVLRQPLVARGDGF